MAFMPLSSLQVSVLNQPQNNKCFKVNCLQNWILLHKGTKAFLQREKKKKEGGAGPGSTCCIKCGQNIEDTR